MDRLVWRDDDVTGKHNARDPRTGGKSVGVAEELPDAALRALARSAGWRFVWSVVGMALHTTPIQRRALIVQLQALARALLSPGPPGLRAAAMRRPRGTHSARQRR